MKIFFFLIIAGSLSIFGANAQNSRAARYNDEIINLQHKYIEKMARFAGSITSTKPDKLTKEKDLLELDLDKAIKKLEKMPDFEGDVLLRDAAIEWFKLSKKIIETDFDDLIPLLKKQPKDELDRARIRSLIEKLIQEEDAIIAVFEKAQADFVLRHGLDLVERPVKL